MIKIKTGGIEMNNNVYVMIEELHGFLMKGYKEHGDHEMVEALESIDIKEVEQTVDYCMQMLDSKGYLERFKQFQN